MQKVIQVLILLCAVAPAMSAVASSQVTPVEKVIELLNNMLEKGKKEKHDETVQFATYKQFCEDTSVSKKKAIEDANDQIEMLNMEIEKHATDAKHLTKEIEAHDEDIAAWTGDVKAATKVRQMEKDDFEALHKDYSESIDALQRAIAVLKKQAYDRPQREENETVEEPAASLLEVRKLKSFNLIPEDTKKVVSLFLQQAEEPEEEEATVGLGVSAPEANAYEFQSHGVIEMLEKLLDKFIAERTDLEKEEMTTQHAYEMLMQELNAEIEEATQDRTQKSEVKAKKLQAKADAEGDLVDTKTTRDADVTYLTDLTATCEQKATDFVSRQELRVEEFGAIQKAIEIISSEAVKGNAETYLPGLVQEKQTSLAQLRSADTNMQSQSRAAKYLQARAQVLKSKVLAALAGRMTDDPFKKVKKMIKDLIVRLMEEANEEAEHKGWCDTEMSTNKQTRTDKTAAVETLTAEIDKLNASIAKLEEDIAALTKAIADLDAAMVEATKIRTDEKAKNAQTIKDAQDAQTAVAQALVVLKEFYARAAEATALLEQPAQPTPPPIFDEPYTGMQAEKGGVVGMLEVIESDFARLEADTKAAEVTAQKEYDQFMTDSKADKAEKSTDLEHKTAKKLNEEKALKSKTADLEGTQKELDAALDYFDKLKPSCVDAEESYEERVARRKEEIESLQEALRILNGEDIVG